MNSTAKTQGLESISIKRATLVDTGKVRYRVYRSAEDYVAVIAENALMAVRVAEITDPFRIVRDLPTEGIALQAERLAKVDVENPAEQISLPIQRAAGYNDVLFVEAKAAPVAGADFVPMQLRDLQKKLIGGRMILLASEVDPIAAPPKAPEVVAASTVAPQPAATAVTEAAVSPAAVTEIAPPAPAEVAPPPSVAETIPTAPAEVVAPAAALKTEFVGETLGPDEVEKLLNG